MSTSLKFMLLGIALLLFGMATPIWNDLLAVYIFPLLFSLHFHTRLVPDLFLSIISIAGIVLVFVGFFKRDK